MGYPSDLSDEDFRLIEPFIPKAKHGGRPRTIDYRALINGILYHLSTDTSLRDLPKSYPSWGYVHLMEARLSKDGTLERIAKALNRPDLIDRYKEKLVSMRIGKDKSKQLARKRQHVTLSMAKTVRGRLCKKS